MATSLQNTWPGPVHRYSRICINWVWLLLDDLCSIFHAVAINATPMSDITESRVLNTKYK